jgi:hypothetical protein
MSEVNSVFVTPLFVRPDDRFTPIVNTDVIQMDVISVVTDNRGNAVRHRYNTITLLLLL